MIFLIFIIIFPCWYLYQHFTYWQKQNVKVSSYFDFRTYLVKHRDQLFDKLKLYGKVYGSYRLFNKVIVVNDPDLIGELFARHSEVLQDHADIYTGSSLIKRTVTLETGETWKRIRSVMSPAFTSSKLKQMMAQISDIADNLLNKMREHGGTMNMSEIINEFTMDITCACSFGIKVDALVNSDHPMIKNAKKIMKPELTVSLLISFVSPRLAKLLRLEPFDLSATNYFQQVTNNILKDRKESDKDARVKDFIQILIDSGLIDKDHLSESKLSDSGRLSPDEVTAQGMAFFLAGGETITTTICNAVYYLCQNPDYQTLLYNELKDIPEFSYDNLQELKYMNAIINETLRLSPPVTLIARLANADLELGKAGIKIPAGATVETLIYALHRDPDYWSDPDLFKPERFIEPVHNAQAFMPFGGGARICLGKQFSYNAIRMCLAKIIKTFEFTLTSGFQIEYENKAIFLIPKQIDVQVQLRN